MRVIKARNVNDALVKGINLILSEGQRESSRAGDVLVMPCPVSTIYERPQERVLFSAARNANPFFHLFESLFYLAGRNDAKWLDQFVHDFSSRFAEDDGRLHGSYGFRWRKHFDIDGGGRPGLPDQLDTIVALLKNNPQDRQAVLTMWDPTADLGIPGLKDRPCNLNACLRVRPKVDVSMIALSEEEKKQRYLKVDLSAQLVLDITVFCRSNDIWWGAYGANAVQFSVLLEYLAARIGVGIGTYTQISNNYHLYENIVPDAKKVLEELDEYKSSKYPAEVFPFITHPECFDEDLRDFMTWTESEEPDQQPQQYVNSWLHLTAEPLFVAHRFWKLKEHSHALEILTNAEQMAPDWRLAAEQWFGRRMASKSKEIAR